MALMLGVVLLHLTVVGELLLSDRIVVFRDLLWIYMLCLVVATSDIL